MPQETGRNITMEYRIPLDSSASRKLEALLNGHIPEPTAFELCFISDRIKQSFELAGLTDYRAAMKAFDVREMLAALCLLCRDVLEHPILMNEELELLAVDRLYWDTNELRWRWLVILGKSEAWAALPEHMPEEIWSALFVAAMETSAEKNDALQSIVYKLEDREFSVELLSATLLDAASAAEEKGKNVSAPAEETDEEYRPWEIAAKPDDEIELGMTGVPMAPRLKNAAEATMVEEPDAEEPSGAATPEETPPEEIPAQPVIPGIAPPPPPPVRVNPSEQRDAVVTNALGSAKPETVVLRYLDPPSDSKVPIGRVEVAQQRIPRVVRMETGEVAYVDRPRFVIGSKPGAVDFLVTGNHVISRRHAAIVAKGTDFFIIDLGSRNGVFVDKRRITPNQETLIYVGDVFVLANEKFRLEW